MEPCLNPQPKDHAMNELTHERHSEKSPLIAACNSCLHEAEDLIRRHPLAAVLTIVGIGCALGMAAREIMTPEQTAKKRALQILEDIQDRLNELTEPLREQASTLAEEGITAAKRGANSLADLKLGTRLRKLFA